MARVLQVKRGSKTNIPTLAQGEFGFTTDANAEELYIGNGAKNIQIARQDYVENVSTVANDAATAAENAQTTANSKAPAYTYGTEDLTAGTSPLETGKLYFVYE